jgi:glycerate 2-kinase
VEGCVKILVAPQAFKGTFSAFEIAASIERGVRKAYPEAEVVLLPISDGGDGFLDVMFHIHAGTEVSEMLTGALGEGVQARWGILQDSQTAVIELAQICGLATVPSDQRNPMMATTAGVGEAIRSALDEGLRRIVIGIGGSATNDAGIGLASTLGVRFLDSSGKELPPGGGALENLDRIDLDELDPRVLESEIIVACDVANSMTGLRGASLVYAPQKGASHQEALLLDRALQRVVEVVERQFGIDLNTVPFSGAAGGTGGGLHAFINASLVSGIDFVLDQMDFNAHLQGASLVLTGEGRIDEQTIYGKGPIVVAKRAKKQGIPVYAFVGSTGEGYEAVFDHGITKVIPLMNT